MHLRSSLTHVLEVALIFSRFRIKGLIFLYMPISSVSISSYVVSDNLREIKIVLCSVRDYIRLNWVSNPSKHFQ